MGSTIVVEKTEAELRKEIEELHRQQWEITERLRDPRGLRRGGLSGNGPRNFGANGAPPRQRGFVRPAERNDEKDMPPPKRRLSSAVVKMEEGEIIDDVQTVKDATTNDLASEGNAGAYTEDRSNRKPPNFQNNGWSRRDGNQRAPKRNFDLPSTEAIPRVLPKNEDPKFVNRNRRMLGQLLGTLEKFRKEDVQLSGTEAFMRRSDSLQRAEQRAREESEKLRQQEREQLSEKRRRDLTLRARVAAKAEEKKLELLFLRWSEHHNKLCNFLRTKAEPPIYFVFKKPLEEDSALVEQQKEKSLQEWKDSRREELSEYQKQIEELNLVNVEKEMERWQNARTPRRGNNNNNNNMNLQESMDQELETHRLEHGPKTRKIPGGNDNEDEDDVEDINVAEDDLMDDVLGVDEKAEAGNVNSHSENIEL